MTTSTLSPRSHLAFPHLEEFGKRTMRAGTLFCPFLSLLNPCRGRVSSLDSRVRDSEDQLQRLQSSRTDQLQAFGPWMRTLVESLQRNRNRFRKMPKGPVGSMICLKDYKWSTAVEQVLRGVLSCFIVDNPYDDAAFKHIASEVLRRGGHGRVDTIICSFQVKPYVWHHVSPCDVM